MTNQKAPLEHTPQCSVSGVELPVNVCAKWFRRLPKVMPIQVPNGKGNTASTVAITAALNVELAPFKKLACDSCLLLETGMGRGNAARSLHSFLSKQNIRAVISIGLAGALSPNLEIGDLVIVRKFLDQIEAKASPKLVALASGIRIKDFNVYNGSVLTVDEIINTAEQRKHLTTKFCDDGTSILDMESSAIAKSCHAFQIPFVIIRSISDRFNEDLPINFNKCLGNDGNLKMTKILLEVLLNPLSLKGLLILRKRSKSCTRNLVSFVEQFLSTAIDPLSLDQFE